MIHANRRSAVCLALVAIAIACGDSNGGDGGTMGTPPSRASVTFVYEATTAIDSRVAEQFSGCVAGVGQTHIHPSWRSFDRVDMSILASDRWTITFDDVPVGSRERIRISDANVCDENPTGAATRNVFANDVRLIEIVDTPGAGTEPGLALTVAADGTVTP